MSFILPLLLCRLLTAIYTECNFALFNFQGCKTDAVRVVKDNDVLSERELQSKKDGSATKSPKMELEELPFVTREYRNLQFQKRKMYALSDGKKRTKKKKNVVSLKKNAENKSVEAAKKGLLSNKNFSYLKHASSKKLMNNNLTDAMKEKLLQKHNENSPRKITLNQVRKSKVLEGNCSASAKNNPEKNVKISIKKSATKLPTISQKDKTIEKVQKIEKKPATNSFKSKSHIFDILKNRSDISLNRFNTRLSYLERHQKESGFNPLSLRCNFQKCLSDTNRSNFGDSAVGDLPEISSQILSVDRASIDTDEELFYLELIENDKRKRLAQRSSRSEAQLDTRRTIDFSATNSCKDGKVVWQII